MIRDDELKHSWCSSASVDLTYAEVLYKDLSKGLESLLLNSYLHLVYLVTPYDLIDQCKPNWMIFFRQVSRACLRASRPPSPPHISYKLLSSSSSSSSAVHTVVCGRAEDVSCCRRA